METQTSLAADEARTYADNVGAMLATGIVSATTAISATYYAARTTAPTETEIEAAAKIYAEAEYGSDLDDLPVGSRKTCLTTAKRMLEAANKAVK
ncbi:MULTISPECIES: hypothetical protein [Bifidobacterium]|uniref:Uncharacterized protein n=2 Tax=Bifidobacterium TaxID=1678 RepID=A0A261FTR0_9BIFI|nr:MULTISPECIES: hypothetical protein [Bifidobacterium]OZG62478.1 hypothetical protein BLEM_1024 [Bifidobacterium lemurum]OZG69014.1 hypothetical protein BEUL_0420 [Bifidobacterium eulemuris]QOL31457.1 hypothetical protein BE0216_02530 [Bifidobacterium eulemuris]QOL33820.1 hypothetical protein BL8807_08550 [Bifidobacterium lemurum]